MTIESYTVQLERVQAAIAAIENADDGAQSVSMDGKSLTRANLDTLYKRETQLLNKIARQRRGGAIAVSHVRYPS